MEGVESTLHGLRGVTEPIGALDVEHSFHQSPTQVGKRVVVDAYFKMAANSTIA
jgi:hypothetical protein